MTSNGMKDVDKTAFQLSTWMTAIVGIVAWRTKCDPMALAMTGGFPLGVLSFWIIYSMGRRAKQEKAIKQAGKATRVQKVESPARAELPARKPVFTTNEPPVPFKTAASVAAAEGYSPKGSTVEDPTVPPDDGEFNFLNSANYLYQPSRGRERQTTVRPLSVTIGLQQMPMQHQQIAMEVGVEEKREEKRPDRKAA